MVVLQFLVQGCATGEEDGVGGGDERVLSDLKRSSQVGWIADLVEEDVTDLTLMLVLHNCVVLDWAKTGCLDQGICYGWAGAEN